MDIPPDEIEPIVIHHIEQQWIDQRIDQRLALMLDGIGDVSARQA